MDKDTFRGQLTSIRAKMQVIRTLIYSDTHIKYQLYTKDIREIVCFPIKFFTKDELDFIESLFFSGDLSNIILAKQVIKTRKKERKIKKYSWII